MTKIILHIGLEKTGTTTIQRVFNSNSKSLMEKGIYYPSYFGEENHVCLYNYSKSKSAIDELRIYSGLKSEGDVERFRVDFRDMFLKDVKNKNPEYLVLSNEHLSSRLSGVEGVNRLKELLENISDDIKVVLYVRNIFDFLVSSYSTAIKCGETKSFIDYIPDGRELPFRYKLSSVVKLWLAVFGKDRVLIRPFSRTHLVGGDILSDFISSTALPVSLEKLKVSNRSENVSLGRDGLELVRRLNKFLPLLKDNAYNPDRGDLVDRVQRSENFKSMGISIEERDKVLVQMKAESEKYSNVLPDAFSKDMGLEGSKYTMKASTKKDEPEIDELIANLWVSLRK